MSANGGFIVLVGEPGSGKSRSAYEAVRAALPEWDLVHARLPTDLAQAAKENAPRRVIWLDDMSRLLDTQHEGLAADFAGLLGSRKPALIIGMLWPTTYDRYTGRHAATVDGDANVLLPVPSAAKEVLDLARVVLVQVALSNSEQERAEEAARHDKQISAALPTTDFGLFQTLAGAPVLLQRWLTGLASGRAVITAAVDARLLGATEPLTREFLVQAAPGYLLPAEFARLTPLWEDEALGYATHQSRRRVHGAAPGAGEGAGNYHRIRPRGLPAKGGPGAPEVRSHPRANMAGASRACHR